MGGGEFVLNSPGRCWGIAPLGGLSGLPRFGRVHRPPLQERHAHGVRRSGLASPHSRPPTRCSRARRGCAPSRSPSGRVAGCPPPSPPACRSGRRRPPPRRRDRTQSPHSRAPAPPPQPPPPPPATT